MKLFLFILLSACIAAFGVSAQTVTGTVRIAQSKQPLVGATIQLKDNKRHTATNNAGQFTLQALSLPDTLMVSYAGYKTQQVVIADSKSPVLIEMEDAETALQEDNVNTGYYQTAKERSTGSFTQISSELLNRSVGTNILERLEGISSGLQFDRRLLT